VLTLTCLENKIDQTETSNLFSNSSY